MSNDNDPKDRFTERAFVVWEEKASKERMCLESCAQPWRDARVLKRIVVRFDNYGDDHSVTEIRSMKRK